MSSSTRNTGSISHTLTDDLLAALADRHGTVDITRRDLAKGIPFIDATFTRATFMSPDDRNAEEHQAMAVSDELVELAEERLRFWAQLKELAGVQVSDHMREAVGENLTRQLEQKLAALKTEYEEKIARLSTQYPVLVARKIAEGLLKANGNETVSQLLEKAQSWKGPAFKAPVGMEFGGAPAP